MYRELENMHSIASLLFIIVGTVAAAPQGVPLNEYAGKRVPVLYEAYYPELREWNPEASLQKLRELTSQLVHEEEQLSSQIANANLENVYEPRSQILEYVFSRPVIPILAGKDSDSLNANVNDSVINNNNNNASDKDDDDAAAAADVENDDVQVSSLTVSESAPTDGHKIRHHHGQANWLLRRITPNTQPGARL